MNKIYKGCEQNGTGHSAATVSISPHLVSGEDLIGGGVAFGQFVKISLWPVLKTGYGQKKIACLS